MLTIRLQWVSRLTTLQSIQRWEVTMTEALTSLRDLAEKRVAPACQRLRLLLQEVQGWASLWVTTAASACTLFSPSLQASI